LAASPFEVAKIETPSNRMASACRKSLCRGGHWPSADFAASKSVAAGEKRLILLKNLFGKSDFGGRAMLAPTIIIVNPVYRQSERHPTGWRFLVQKNGLEGSNETLWGSVAWWGRS